MDLRQHNYQFSAEMIDAPSGAGTTVQPNSLQSYVDPNARSSYGGDWNPPSYTDPGSVHTTINQRHTPWQANSYQPVANDYITMPPYSTASDFPTQDYSGHNAHLINSTTQAFAAKQSRQHSYYEQQAGFGADQSSGLQSANYQTPSDLRQLPQTVTPAATLSLHYSGEHSQEPSASSLSVTSLATQVNNITPSVRTLSNEAWRQLASNNIKSISRNEFHIKPTTQYESSTSSKRFDGFIFVGLGPASIHCTKSTLPRYRRRKSRNEALKLLLAEKAGGLWNADREALVKRLKVAAGKTAAQSTNFRGPPNAPSSPGNSDRSSDDESLGETVKSPEDVCPVPATRPLDPNKAVEYDLLKAAWAKRSTVLTSNEIRSALSEIWDIFYGIRDRWRQKSASLQHAIEKKDRASEKAFERRSAEQRAVLETCLKLVLAHGHPSIVGKLAENPLLLVVFYQFLADRFKEGEYVSVLVNNILEVMKRAELIDTPLLEKTKMDKLLLRIQKRSDQSGKQLAQQILRNASTMAMKQNSAGQNPSIPDLSQSQLPKVVNEKIRRPEEPAPKTSSSVRNAPIGSNNSKIKHSVDESKLSEIKAKPVPMVSKAPGLFSSLKSASKRSSAAPKIEDNSTIGQISPEKNQQEKPRELVAPAVKPAFSFAATMAGLSKQKDDGPKEQEDFRKVETPEEKTKRERKESRRKLRVSWKPDEELESVRIFDQDPEVAAGHTAGQTRHVRDTKSEGALFKFRHEHEIDDDDDYEPPEDFSEHIDAWFTPTLTDFDVISAEERCITFTKRGGEVYAVSSEREVQNQREQTTLVAIYESNADIPANPREPPAFEFDGAAPVSERLFGDPIVQYIKDRQERYRSLLYHQQPNDVDIQKLINDIKSGAGATLALTSEIVPDLSSIFGAAKVASAQNFQPQMTQPYAYRPPPPPQYNPPSQSPYTAQRPSHVSASDLDAILKSLNPNHLSSTGRGKQGLQGSESSTNEDRKHQLEKGDVVDRSRKKSRSAKAA